MGLAKTCASWLSDKSTAAASAAVGQCWRYRRVRRVAVITTTCNMASNCKSHQIEGEVRLHGHLPKAPQITAPDSLLQKQLHINSHQHYYFKFSQTCVSASPRSQPLTAMDTTKGSKAAVGACLISRQRPLLMCFPAMSVLR